MVDKKQKGNLTELQCISAFYEMGYSVSIPYGENNRYDFIADVDGHLIKVQVKTSSTKDDGKSYTFSCRSSRTNGKRTINKKYTKSEIDFFATFIKGKCYLVPVEECSTTKCLRFDVSQNKQQIFVNFEENYRIEKQIKSYLNKH
jgi:hypothetical protein